MCLHRETPGVPWYPRLSDCAEIQLLNVYVQRIEDLQMEKKMP